VRNHLPFFIYIAFDFFYIYSGKLIKYMAAGRYSFVLEQGATFNIQLDWKDGDSNPIDLTGYHARMQLRPTVESSEVILSLSSSLDESGSGIFLSGSTNDLPLVSGSVAIYISANTSENLDFNEAYYDLEMVNGANVTRLIEGKVKLSKNVTR
jgi:hypothetical protein